MYLTLYSVTLNHSILHYIVLYNLYKYLYKKILLLRLNVLRPSNVSQRDLVYNDKKRCHIWSPARKNRTTWQISQNFLQIQKLKSRFLHEKIIFFCLDFFLVKIRFCTVQKSHLQHPGLKRIQNGTTGYLKIFSKVALREKT